MSGKSEKSGVSGNPQKSAVSEKSQKNVKFQKSEQPCKYDRAYIQEMKQINALGIDGPEFGKKNTKDDDACSRFEEWLAKRREKANVMDSKAEGKSAASEEPKPKVDEPVANIES